MAQLPILEIQGVGHPEERQNGAKGLDHGRLRVKRQLPGIGIHPVGTDHDIEALLLPGSNYRDAAYLFSEGFDRL